MNAIDEEALQARYGGREAMITKLCNTFLRTHGDTATKVRRAIAEEDYETLRNTAHSLKGLAGYLEARELLHIAERAQLIAQQDNAEALAVCDDMADALDRLVVALKQRLSLAQ